MNDVARAAIAFENLRAEDEPWLAECYVPPPDFSVMASWRSVLIFGESGMGNTALRLALERRVAPADQPPSVLLAHWPLTTWVAPSAEGTSLVSEHHRMALDAVARALVEYLGRYPNTWGSAPGWAQKTLVWFIHRYFKGDLAHMVELLCEEGNPDGCALLRAILTSSVWDILPPDAAPMLVVAELVKGLEKLGLNGVWVLVADVEPWLQVDADRLVTTFHAYLTTLALFEHPRFAYKMFLPEALEASLGKAGGIVRHRMETFNLRWQWQPSVLQTMVEKRLAWALGRPGFTLADLCELPNLSSWLQRCASYSPRGWLQFTRPFLSAYLAANEGSDTPKPLTQKACREIQRRHPPRLYLDEETGRVTVGLRTIENLAPGTYALLRHLYRHRGKVCSWRELYRVYVEAYPDSVADPDARRAEYAGTLDTALWRLRQEIEPDPKLRLLIVTVKQAGVRLDNAW